MPPSLGKFMARIGKRGIKFNEVKAEEKPADGRRYEAARKACLEPRRVDILSARGGGVVPPGAPARDGKRDFQEKI
jgi:hypothetical protein